MRRGDRILSARRCELCRAAELHLCTKAATSKLAPIMVANSTRLFATGGTATALGTGVSLHVPFQRCYLHSTGQLTSTGVLRLGARDVASRTVQKGVASEHWVRGTLCITAMVDLAPPYLLLRFRLPFITHALEPSPDLLFLSLSIRARSVCPCWL